MEFQIGTVLRRTFGALGRNLVVFLLLSFLLSGLPNLLATWAIGDPANPSFSSTAQAALVVVASLVSLITYHILQGALIQGAIADFSGKSASLAECVSTGLKHLLPIIAIALLMGLAVGLGMVLLLIPGIILLVMWAVAIPARVAENTGVFEAFGRSRELTQGNRWRIFLLLVVYFVLAIVISGLIGLMTGFNPGSSALGLISSLVTNTLTTVIAAVGTAALYFELRRTKEGVEAAELLAVFD